VGAEGVNIHIRNAETREDAAHAARIAFRFAEDHPYTERGHGPGMSVVYASSREDRASMAAWWTKAGAVTVGLEGADDC